MAPDLTLVPLLWLLRSLPWEIRELFFGTKRASLPGEGGTSKSKQDYHHAGESGATVTLFNSEGMRMGSSAEQALA